MAGLRAGNSRGEPWGEGRPFQPERVANDKGLRDRLILARSLGISYKRLNGWEPETTYVHEGDRLVSSRPEPEWDEEQVAWFLHLAEWEADRCPSCGMQRSVCQDPMAEWNVEVPAPTRCHVTTAIKRAQKGYAKSEVPEALLFGAQMRA